MPRRTSGALSLSRLVALSPFRALAVCLFLLLGAVSAGARVDKPHPSIDPHNVTASLTNGPIDLSSTWLEMQGDDPRYADPHFNDSQWPVVSARHRSKIFKVKGPDGRLVSLPRPCPSRVARSCPPHPLVSWHLDDLRQRRRGRQLRPTSGHWRRPVGRRKRGPPF